VKLPYVLEFTECAVQSTTVLFSFFYPAGKIGGAQILRFQGIAELGCALFAMDLFGAGVRPTEVKNEQQHTG
jgi:hypothetical protein